jgi:hypothetical protein
VALTAAAVFVQVPMEHFLSHGEPAFVQQAMEDRAHGAPAWRSAADTVSLEVNP